MADGSLSRRRALKLFAGSAIAALIPSRALADDDCVRVCHVPFDRETEECDFANAETRCVSRSRRRFHLENHPCDCRGRCANCLTSTTTSTTTSSTTSTSTSTSTSTTSTTTTPPPAVHEITCICDDPRFLIQRCSSIDCSQDKPVAFCEPLCGAAGVADVHVDCSI